MNDKLRALVNAPVSLYKGLTVTMTNLLRTKTTVRYPEVMPTPAGRAPREPSNDPFARPYELAPRFRGLHGLTADDTGDLNCIGCMACAKVCPDDLISMDLEKREGHSGRFPVTFTVNIGPCCFCGLCSEVCPTPMRAIVMTDLFEWATYRRDGSNLVLSKADLIRHGELEVLRRSGGRKFGEDGSILEILPEEEGNPYFQYAPEYEAERRAKGEKDKAPKAEPAAQPAAASEAAPVAAPVPPVPTEQPAPVADAAPDPAAAPADEPADQRAAVAAMLTQAGIEFGDAPESLSLDALDGIEDRKVRAQAKSALRKLQKSLGLVD